MSTEKIDKLYQQLAPIDDSNERHGVYSLLLTQIASELEHIGTHDAQHAAGPIWEAANTNLNQMIEQDPNQAFDFGLKLTNLPQSSRLHQWLIGNGLIVISHPNLQPQLQKHLLSNQSLSATLDKLANLPIPADIATKYDLSKHPMLFAQVMALRIKHSLDPNFLPTDSEIQRILGLYYSISDTRDLVADLLVS